MESQIQSLDRYTVEALIGTVANKQSSITYGGLAEAVGQLRGEPMSPRGFSECLGRIQEYCMELGLPALSVMVTPKGESTSTHEVDPIKDLVPVCPNCHAVIHSKKSRDEESSVYTPNEVRAMLRLSPLEAQNPTPGTYTNHRGLQ